MEQNAALSPWNRDCKFIIANGNSKRKRSSYSGGKSASREVSVARGICLREKPVSGQEFGEYLGESGGGQRCKRYGYQNCRGNLLIVSFFSPGTL